MTISDLRALAAHHAKQARTAERDANMAASQGWDGLAAFTREKAAFHAGMAQKLTELADAFAGDGPRQFRPHARPTGARVNPSSTLNSKLP